MKKLACLFVGFLVLFPAALAQADATTPEKEEVIFAVTTPEGDVDAIAVMNGFPNNNGKIRDYGAYDQVKNVTDASKLKNEGGQVTAETDSTAFYYQGMADPSKPMPWNVRLTYNLDGKQIKGDDLKGKDGHLKIDIKINRNAGANPIYIKNYMLQMSLRLDEMKFHNIVSPEATIGTDDTIKVVTYTIFPDEDAHFTIETDLSNAEPFYYEVVALPLNLGMDIPIDELTGPLTELKEAIAQLKDGIFEYTDGVTEAGQGVDELAAGISELYASTPELGAGVNELATGAGQLGAGANELVGGVNELASGAAELGAGLDEFSGGITEFAGGLQELGKGADELKAGTSELNGGATELNTGLTQQFGPGLKEAQLGAKGIDAGVQQLADGLGEAKQGIEMDQGLQSGADQLRAGIQELYDGVVGAEAPEQAKILGQLLGTLTLMPEPMKNMDNELEKLMGKLQVIEAAAGEYENIDAVIADLNEIKATISPEALGIDRAANPDAAATLDAQIAKIDADIASLASSSAKVKAVNDVTSGLWLRCSNLRINIGVVLDALNSINITELSAALDTSELEAGVTQLHDGYEQLYAGLQELFAGIDEAYTGITQRAVVDKDGKCVETCTENGEPDYGLKQAVEMLSAGLDQLVAGFDKELAPGAEDLAAGAGALDEGATELQAGTVQLRDAIPQLKGGITELKAGAGELTSGAGQLRAGGAEFGAGVTEFQAGVAQLQAGAGELQAGVGQLNDGAGQLKDGFAQIGAGTGELRDGAGQLRDETKTMDTDVMDMVDEELGALLPHDYDIPSFMDDRNGNVNLVQFTYFYDPEIIHEDEVNNYPWWKRILYRLGFFH